MSTPPDLRDIRKGKSLTLQQVAMAASLNVSNVSRIERGQLPQPAHAIRLAEVLEIDPVQVYASILARFAKSANPQFKVCSPRARDIAIPIQVAQDTPAANELAVTGPDFAA